MDLLNITINYEVKTVENKPFCDCTLRYYDVDRAGLNVIEDALISGFLGRLNVVAKEQIAAS